MLLLCALRLPWPQSARADVIYSGLQDIPIPANFDGVYLNLVTQQHATTEISGWDVNPFFGGLGIANSPSFQPTRLGTDSGDSIVPLSFGSSINGSLSFASGYGGSGAEDNSGHLGPGLSQFTDGQSAYFGFQVTRNGSASYGWMQVTLTRNGSTGVIQDWAYDTSGGTMLAGATGSVGAAPIIVQAGTEQTATASTAGTAVLVAKDSQFTFQQSGGQGNFSGVISGGGNVKVSGAGGVRLTGTNTFTGNAAVLDGSSLTVSSKDNLGSAAVQLNPAAALVFDSSAANNGANNTFANPITISSATSTLSNTGSGTVVLSGSISGAGGVNISGAGGVCLSGTNTFAGTAAVLDGSSLTVTSKDNLGTAAVQLNPAAALVFDSSAANNGANNTFANPITISSATSTLSNTGSGTVVLSGSISGAGGVNISGAGGVCLSGTNTFAGTAAVLDGSSLTVTSKDNLGTAAVQLNPAAALVFDSVASNNGANNTFANPITISSATSTLSNTGSGTVILSGSISGAGGVNNSGAGGVCLSGTNTFAGTAAVLDGSSLTVTSKDNLGTAPIELNPSSALVFDSDASNNGTNNTFANPITVTSATGTLRNTGSGTVVLTGSLTKDGSVLAFAGGNFSISGAILGNSPNSDLLVDAATVSLLSSNAYDGPTYIRNGGTLNAISAGSLPSLPARSPIVMDDSGSGSSNLILGASQQIASLSGTSTSSVALGSNTLTLGAASGSSTFAGIISGSGGSLVKDGASTQVLSGSNTYGGTTLVSAGTLLVNGSNSGTGTVSVSSGGTLGGSGSIAGAVNVSGILSPGISAAAVLSTGSLTFNNGSVFVYGMNSSAATSVAADLLKISGDLTLNGTVNLNLHDLAASPTAFAPNTTLALVNYNGTWNGGYFNCNSQLLTEGTQFTVGANTWTIHYADTHGGSNFSGEYVSGHFINLISSLTAVPEPASWLALATLLVSGSLFRSRRRPGRERMR